MPEPCTRQGRRIDETAGLQWKAQATAADSLAIDAGVGFAQQANVDGTDQRYPAGRLAAGYRHSFSKAAYAQELADYIPDLQQGGAYRADSETSLVAPPSAHIGIKLAYAVRYNSRRQPRLAPPTGSSRRACSSPTERHAGAGFPACSAVSRRTQRIIHAS